MRTARSQFLEPEGTSRTRVDVPRLLELLGVRARREGDVWRAPCPSPDHDDHDPSWTIRDDDGPSSGSHWCFSCGFGGGPWELAAAVRGTTVEEAGAWVLETLVRVPRAEATPEDVPLVRVATPADATSPTFTLPRGVVIPSLDGAEWFPAALAYLRDRRRVPDWQLERWHVGYATRGRCAFRVVVPVHTRGVLVSYVARAFIEDGRRRYDVARRTDPGARPDLALFGEPGFDEERDVATVTEGVFSMLAMERAGAPNPCAILGAANLGPEKVALLAGFSRLLVATDPDKAGDDAAERIERATCRYCDVIRLELSASPDDLTDDECRAAWATAV